MLIMVLTITDKGNRCNTCTYAGLTTPINPHEHTYTYLLLFLLRPSGSGGLVFPRNAVDSMRTKPQSAMHSVVRSPPGCHDSGLGMGASLDSVEPRLATGLGGAPSYGLAPPGPARARNCHQSPLGIARRGSHLPPGPPLRTRACHRRRSR